MQKGAEMSRTPRPAVRKSQWKKPLTFTNQGLLGLVAWGGIEPPTQGFSIDILVCSGLHATRKT